MKAIRLMLAAPGALITILGLLVSFVGVGITAIGRYLLALADD